MGPQQGQSRDTTRVEAIDLTLSSPEPEPRSRRRSYSHAQQQQPAKTMKDGSHRRIHNINDHAQRHGSTWNGNTSQQRQRRIDPQHVKQMIDTSNHRALRSVVLQLCETSPALCGALVRGLEPHSPWAQALISRQRAKSQIQAKDTTKTEAKTNEQDAYERMRKRLGINGDSQSPAAQIRTNRPSAGHEDRDHLRVPPNSRKVPTVKHEHRASPTDSDDSTNIVEFSAAGRGAQTQEPTRRTTTCDSSRHHSIAHQYTGRPVARENDDSVRDQEQKLCSQCGELYEEGDVMCYFHPGHESLARPGDIPLLTCCEKFAGEPGCRIGQHTNEELGTLTIAKRPSPSTQSGTQWSKKPRFL
ncbi:hypothetical protein SVAN01_04610 [Stagonosporopsis vannaccii]|nr:hypothetical protein SVAN01_04610 [Stagonosporopsis vannaccii]